MQTHEKDTKSIVIFLFAFIVSITSTFAQYVVEANVAYSKGVACLKRGKDAKAVACFRKVLKQEPQHDAACLMLIKLHLSKDHRKQAAFYIDHLARIKATSIKRDLERDYYLAFRDIELAKYIDAREQIEAIITKLHKERNFDFNLLARTYNALGYLDVVENQQGRSSKNRLVLHERDLLNARFLFEEALRYKPSSQIAATNYNRVNTALRVSPNKIDPYQVNDFEPVSYPSAAPALKTYSDAIAVKQEWLPAKVHWVIEDFSNYDELIFMMDASGSMRVPSEMNTNISRFDWMKNLSYHLLKKIKKSTNLGVIAVGGECGEQPSMQFSTASSRFEIANAIKHLQADGQTPVNEAMRVAKGLFKKNGKSKALLFMTDGMESCEPELTCELSAQLGELGVELHILSFLDQAKARNEYISYTCMAESTGGSLKGLSDGKVEKRDYQYQIEEQLIVPLLAPKTKDKQSVVLGY
ncbi:MAG: VWA domain-containing protein [Bacteroidota bacterium]